MKMTPLPVPTSRRSFLRSSALAVAGAALVPRFATAAEPAVRRPFTALGIAASLDKAIELKAAGAQFLTESVGNFLVPDQGDDVFTRNLEKLAASPLPILACNSFIRPPHLR